MLLKSLVPAAWYAPDAGGADGETPPADGGNGADKPRTFTQAEVDAIMGKTRKEARDATQGSLLKEFGVESLDAIKASLEEAKKLKEAQMTEVDKQKAALEKAQAEKQETETRMQTALQQANERLMRAAVMLEAGKADYKVNPAALSDVWLFVDKTKLELTEDGEVKGLADAVKAVLAAKPYLQQNGPVKGVPPTPPANGTDELTDEQKRKQAVSARSYW